MSLRLGEDIVMPQRVEIVDVRLLEAVAEELVAGKIQIAQAINNAGGTASEDESLAELAEDITTMPIVNVGAFKFSEVPNLAKQIAEQTYSGQLGADFRAKLTEIDDANGDITSVGDYAFQNCMNLESVNLPNVTSVGTSAFRGTSVTRFIFPNVTSISTNSFASLTECDLLDIRSCAQTITTYPYFAPTPTPAGGFRLFVGVVRLDSLTVRADGRVWYPFVYAEEMHIKFCKTLGSIGGTNGLFINLILLNYTAIVDEDVNNNGWTASTYLVNSAEQWENRLTLYQNLLTYTINRLYDHSQDGVTRTFRLGFYATLFADSQLNTEPYGSYYTPLIKAAAQACIDEATRRGWTLSA